MNPLFIMPDPHHFTEFNRRRQAEQDLDLGPSMPFSVTTEKKKLGLKCKSLWEMLQREREEHPEKYAPSTWPADSDEP